MSRPSVFFDSVDEPRNEYDWMYEFMGRMAERIRGDADVHSLADYVQKLEDENAKLREELAKWKRLTAGIDLPEYPVTQFKPKDLERENAKLRRLVADMWFWRYEGHIDSESQERQMSHIDAVIQRMRELGIEVDE